MGYWCLPTTYDCDSYNLYRDFRLPVLGGMNKGSFIAGAFILHITLPVSQASKDFGACCSYDCDGCWNVNDIIALASCGGSVFYPDDGNGLFRLHINAQATHYAWEVGACLL